MSNYQFSSVQSLSRVWLFETPWTAACQASLSIANSRSLLTLMSIESVMPSNNLTLCLSLLPPSIFPSIGVFSKELGLRSGGQSFRVSASASIELIKGRGYSYNYSCWLIVITVHLLCIGHSCKRNDLHLILTNIMKLLLLYPHYI